MAVNVSRVSFEAFRKIFNLAANFSEFFRISLKMHLQPTEKYQFDEFELDVPKRQLRRGGAIVELKPKAFDLLLVLVENSGKLLSKDDLFQMVWENQFVEESNLTVNMSQIRKALGEKASQPRFITTVSGQGYRFVGDVRESGEEADEFVIESQTIARVTVEDFEDEKGEKVPALSGHPDKKSRTFLIGAGLALIILLLVVGGYFWQSSRAKIHVSFSNISMKRLTNLGNINNAALSPDGKLYAYVLLEKDGRQSLWLGHTNGGGESIQLRPAAEINYLGINFAPDSNNLFYNVSGNGLPRSTIFRIGVFGGVPEKIYENVENYITFSPDGKQFAFVRSDRENRKSSLITVETNGTNEREIASRPLNLAFSPTSAAWSPDGKQIAVSAENDENTGTTEVFLVAIENGSIKPLTNLGWDEIRSLIWEKDGSGLFAVAGEKDARWQWQIRHISYPGGEAQRVVSDLNVYSAVLGLSPNGDLMTLQAQHSSNLWVAPAEKLAAAKQITFEQLGRKSGWDAIEWTIDGRLAYTAFTSESETFWTIDADGKNQKQLIPEGRTNTNLNFSAGASKMVFSSNRGGSLEIWAANGDGSNMRQLTGGGNNTQPAISPDGNWVVYRSVRNDAGLLWRVSSAGGEASPFTEKPATWARFSPDGKLIACGYRIDGTIKLTILNAENGQPVKFFDLPPTANLNNGFRWTPDGKAVTYRDWNNGIWRQDLSGGTSNRIAGLPEEKLYSYDWSPDGKFFAFTRGTEIRDLVLIQNTK
jgi:Tol biopolymer transport system component/DNA-binding winged helix-turn-helix (wHTH) protein